MVDVFTLSEFCALQEFGSRGFFFFTLRAFGAFGGVRLVFVFVLRECPAMRGPGSRGFGLRMIVCTTDPIYSD